MRLDCTTALAAGALLVASPLFLEAEDLPPVSVALSFDTSGSLHQDDLERAGQLTTDLMAALPPGSAAAVFSFDDQSRLVLPATTDASALETAIRGLRRGGRYTALNDAIFDASRTLAETKAGRRAMILLTDGRDDRGALSLEDGLRAAQDAGIPVFSVGLGAMDQRVLRRIAKLTGGDYFPFLEATGALLAQRILAIPAAATPPPPAAVTGVPLANPAPAASPLAAAPAPSGGGAFWLWIGGGAILLLAAAAVLVVVVAGQRTSQEVSSAAATPARTPAASRSRPLPTEGEPETVFARMPLDSETVERTLLLRESAVLEVTEGPDRGRVFALPLASSTSIGRARANDVVLDDEAISGQHVRIRPEDGRYVLHDLGSTNGTRVNARKVAKHVLHDADVIQLGDTTLRFREMRTR